MPSQADNAASKPQWEIVRISKRLDYFEGIEARDSSEAIALFRMGHGALNQERTEDAPYEFRAVRVDYAPYEQVYQRVLAEREAESSD